MLQKILFIAIVLMVVLRAALLFTYSGTKIMNAEHAVRIAIGQAPHNDASNMNYIIRGLMILDAAVIFVTGVLLIWSWL